MKNSYAFGSHFLIEFRPILEAFWPPKTSLLAPPEPFKIMLKSVLNMHMHMHMCMAVCVDFGLEKGGPGEAF